MTEAIQRRSPELPAALIAFAARYVHLEERGVAVLSSVSAEFPIPAFPRSRPPISRISSASPFLPVRDDERETIDPKQPCLPRISNVRSPQQQPFSQPPMCARILRTGVKPSSNSSLFDDRLARVKSARCSRRGRDPRRCRRRSTSIRAANGIIDRACPHHAQTRRRANFETVSATARKCAFRRQPRGRDKGAIASLRVPISVDTD